MIQSNKISAVSTTETIVSLAHVRHVSSHFRIASLIAVEFHPLEYTRYMRRVFLQPFEGKVYFTDADINYIDVSDLVLEPQVLHDITVS